MYNLGLSNNYGHCETSGSHGGKYEDESFWDIVMRTHDPNNGGSEPPETSVYFYETWHNSPEGCHLHYSQLFPAVHPALRTRHESYRLLTSNHITSTT
jgi:hypothetical protein